MIDGDLDPFEADEERRFAEQEEADRLAQHMPARPAWPAYEMQNALHALDLVQPCYEPRFQRRMPG